MTPDQLKVNPNPHGKLSRDFVKGSKLDDTTVENRRLLVTETGSSAAMRTKLATLAQNFTNFWPANRAQRDNN
eukprot:scaffold3380_cov50-Attheya_sp.AAC.3